MCLVVITGPPAVGKMTVGLSLAELTGLKLFHNHMSLDLTLNFFDWKDPQFKRLSGDIRRRVFEEVAASDLPGLIFTYVWAFDDPGDKVGIDKFSDIFLENGKPTYFVELYATLDVRLKRNESELRLAHKPPKRDLEHSRAGLLRHEENHQLNSKPGEFYYPDQYLRIDNTNLSPEEVAHQINEKFSLV